MAVPTQLGVVPLYQVMARLGWTGELAAVIVRPGGFTVGAASLANELLYLAGLHNTAAEQGLDRWGSLSMEALLTSGPELIVLTGYRSSQPSLANAVLEHPALHGLSSAQRTVTCQPSSRSRRRMRR